MERFRAKVRPYAARWRKALLEHRAQGILRGCKFLWSYPGIVRNLIDGKVGEVVASANPPLAVSARYGPGIRITSAGGMYHWPNYLPLKGSSSTGIPSSVVVVADPFSEDRFSFGFSMFDAHSEDDFYDVELCFNGIYGDATEDEKGWKKQAGAFGVSFYDKFWGSKAAHNAGAITATGIGEAHCWAGVRESITSVLLYKDGATLSPTLRGWSEVVRDFGTGIGQRVSSSAPINVADCVMSFVGLWERALDPWEVRWLSTDWVRLFALPYDLEVSHWFKRVQLCVMLDATTSERVKGSVISVHVNANPSGLVFGGTIGVVEISVNRPSAVSAHQWRDMIEKVLNGAVQQQVDPYVGSNTTPQQIDAGWADLNFFYFDLDRLSAGDKTTLENDQLLTGVSWSDMIDQGAALNVLRHVRGDIKSEFPTSYHP